MNRVPSQTEEFYHPDTSDERRTELLKEVQAEAEAEPSTADAKCIEGETVFYVEHDKALIPGHIYSRDGITEYRVSRTCEFHFDLWMKDPEDD